MVGWRLSFLRFFLFICPSFSKTSCCPDASAYAWNGMSQDSGVPVGGRHQKPSRPAVSRPVFIFKTCKTQWWSLSPSRRGPSCHLQFVQDRAQQSEPHTLSGTSPAPGGGAFMQMSSLPGDSPGQAPAIGLSHSSDHVFMGPRAWSVISQLRLDPGLCSQHPLVSRRCHCRKEALQGLPLPSQLWDL